MGSGKRLFIFLLCLPVVVLHAQTVRMYKYVVFFKDKDTTFSITRPGEFLSPRAIARKEAAGVKIDVKDLPVSPAYIRQFSDSIFIVRNTSRWFNCAVVFSEQKNGIDLLSKYKGVEKVIEVGYSAVKKAKSAQVDLDQMVAALEQKFVRNRNRRTSDSSAGIYGAGLTQASMLNVPALHNAGLNGNGTLVAVIDAGFSRANTHKVFAATLKNVVATYDFVDLEENVFDDDNHGTAVWSCLGANDTFNYIGTAPGAQYVLLRSEDAGSEFPVEEFYWAMAAEYADSIGVDVISTSLGYNEFGDSRFDYTQKQLNGKTAWITQAAVTASKKGMLVVTSAGNEGDNNWKQITFPSDADEVITVGAVDKNGDFASFSSIGPTADKRKKPNVMAMGEGAAIASELGNVHTGNGTSYSCPVLAGGIVCLWPELRSYDHTTIRAFLQMSASAYDHPDKYFGYGVPDLSLMREFARHHAIDTLLNVKLLDDGCFHAALYATAKQKVHFTITDSLGRVMMMQTVQVKQKGNTRIRLNKLKNVTPGKYFLTAEFPATVCRQELEVK
jgi:serine protease AprX